VNVISYKTTKNMRLNTAELVTNLTNTMLLVILSAHPGDRAV